jgi:hypothetical protein
MPTPTLVVDITFLSPEAGGRQNLPLLQGYRPHLVADNHSPETYLGVYFLEGPDISVSDQALRCRLVLVYYPDVDYSALQIGTTFTIREGPHVVGSGTVISASEPHEA